MPRLNSVGDAAQGTFTGGVSVNGVQPPALVGVDADQAHWFDDDTLILQYDSGGAKIGHYVVSTDTLTLVEALGANRIGAGNGIWTAWLSGTGVRSSIAGFGPFASAGLGDVSPDGQSVLIVSQSSASGLAVYDNTGARVLNVAVSLSDDLAVRLRDDVLSYPFNDAFVLRAVSTGVLLSFTSQTAVVDQLVPVTLGSRVFVVEVVENLTIRGKDSTQGYDLGATGACFTVDAVALSSTVVRIAYATGAGELPAELVLIDINPVTGVWSRGTVSGGTIVWAQMGTAPIVTLPGTATGGLASPFRAVLNHPIAEIPTGALTPPWRKAFQDAANQSQANSEAVNEITGGIGGTDIATALGEKADDDQPFLVTEAAPALTNSTTLAVVIQRGTVAGQPAASAVPIGSLYCQTDGTPVNRLQRTNGSAWQDAAPGAGSGDVVGPGSATDNAIARFDTTTGKLIQNSGITIADGATGALSGTNTGDQSVQTLLDGISSTQGTVLYRGASAWSGLAPGTSGQFLETLGAAANPTWATLPSGSGNQISTTAIGSEPGSPATGDTDLYTNAPYLARYSGALWAPFGPLFKFTTPTATFSWVNQGSATIATTNGGLLLTGAATGSGANLQIRVESPGAAPWSRIAYLSPVLVQKAFQGYGVCFRQSSDGKLAVLNVISSDAGLTTLAIASSKYTSATAFSADYQLAHTPEFVRWIKIEDDNTNRKISISANGLNWLLFHSVGRTDFLTADQVGFYVSTENSATPNFAPILHVLSWA